MKISTLRDYFQLASVTLSDNGEHLNRAHCLTGIKTEVGEAFDNLKRHVFYKAPFDLINLCEELGDIVWYPNIVIKELTDKNLLQVSPFKHSDLVEWLDKPLEDFVTHCVNEFLFDEDEDTLDTPSNEAKIFLEDFFKGSKFNLVPHLDDILRCAVEEESSLLDICSFTVKKVALISHVLGIPFVDILRGNIGKLLKRYPQEKFDLLDTSIRQLSDEQNKVKAAISKSLDKATTNYSLNSYCVEFEYLSL